MIGKNIKITLFVIFLVSAFCARIVHPAGVTIPNGYTLNVQDETLNLTEADILNNGTLNVNTGTVTLGGNWSNYGIFTSGNGTVKYTGTGIQTISGESMFYNFICTSAGDQLSFEAGKSQTVAIILNGSL